MTDKNWYVICADYVQGPYAEDLAQRAAARELTGKWACTLPHRAERHDHKPVPAWQAADDWPDADA